MARHETDREDLLREATALAERAEFALPGQCDPVVVGFRRDGAASIFFGSDPVYQFNAAGELRRAYVGGLLYKALQRGVVELRRERSAGQVQLLRRELSPPESDAFTQQALGRLRSLRGALQAGHGELKGQVPADGDVMRRILKWLDRLPDNLAIAGRPHVR